MITGLPKALHFLIKAFWTTGTSSVGISTPMSPRATIKPSETFKISSILSIPSWFSILGMIWMCVAFSSSKILVISKTSEARRTKLAAIKSIP